MAEEGGREGSVGGGREEGGGRREEGGFEQGPDSMYCCLMLMVTW